MSWGISVTDYLATIGAVAAVNEHAPAGTDIDAGGGVIRVGRRSFLRCDTRHAQQDAVAAQIGSMIKHGVEDARLFADGTFTA